MPPPRSKTLQTMGSAALRQFRTTFDEWVATAKSEQHGTDTFYQENYR
jgi:hypothetical protein